MFMRTARKRSTEVSAAVIDSVLSAPETKLTVVVSNTSEATPAYYTAAVSNHKTRELSPLDQMFAYYEPEAI